MNQVITDHALPESYATAPLTRAGWARLAMVLFLISDAMTFGGLLIGYAVLRAHNADWPSPAAHLSLPLGVLMTLLLLGSSVTMLRAHAAVKNGNHLLFAVFMRVTIAAGIAFLLLQGYEWRHLLHQGMTVSSNPWGAPLFGATFFTLTGFHGLHVFAGVLYLAIVLFQGTKRTDLAAYDPSVEILGLYWHFVDIVWVFVFTSVYLL
jgi:heme/copper-type cytochrome/quinol oxidase subunit 3